MFFFTNFVKKNIYLFLIIIALLYAIQPTA